MPTTAFSRPRRGLAARAGLRPGIVANPPQAPNTGGWPQGLNTPCRPVGFGHKARPCSQSPNAPNSGGWPQGLAYGQALRPVPHMHLTLRHPRPGPAANLPAGTQLRGLATGSGLWPGPAANTPLTSNPVLHTAFGRARQGLATRPGLRPTPRMHLTQCRAAGVGFKACPAARPSG